MCRSGLVTLDFIFGCRVSSGHPSHCRPNLVLLDLFLLLSPLQVVTHLSSDLSCCFWTSCSAIPFSAVTHPTAGRARCCLTFFFECLLFRVVAHPSADLARFPWTSSSAVPFFGGHPFHCRSSSVLFLPFSSIVSSSGGHPSKCRPGPVLLDFMFGCPVLRNDA